jgi:PAS domain S-box-containing protein
MGNYLHKPKEVCLLNNVKPILTEDVKREAAVLHHNYERIMRELGIGKSVLFRYFYQTITSQESSFFEDGKRLLELPQGGENKNQYEMNIELLKHINNLENKLLHLEKKHKAIIDNVKGVIFQTDKEGLWTFLTPTWTKITGFSIEECIGTFFLNYVYPEDREFHHKQFLAIIERERSFCRYEIRYSTKKGEFRWIEIYTRLTTDEYGNIVGTLGTLHDITLQRKTEKMLHLAYELRRRSDFLNDIIMGSMAVDEVSKEYMQTIGLDISRPLFCCLVVSKGFIGREKEQNSIIEVLGDEKNCIVWNCRNDIGVIYQGIEEGPGDLENSVCFAHSLLEKIRQCDPQLKVVIGVSSIQTGFDSIRKTYWQGWSATIAAQCQNKEDGIYHYKDLGILQLLVKNIGNEGADEFVQEQIGKLILYDREKGTNFLDTLEEILQNSNLKKTAEKMFLHPKTVVFRKQRIEKILGVSIDLFENRLALAVALKLHAVSRILKKN